MADYIGYISNNTFKILQYYCIIIVTIIKIITFISNIILA